MAAYGISGAEMRAKRQNFLKWTKCGLTERRQPKTTALKMHVSRCYHSNHLPPRVKYVVCRLRRLSLRALTPKLSKLAQLGS